MNVLKLKKVILNICPNPSIDSYAWFSNFQIGEVNRMAKLQDFPGGKGVHVAHAIKELDGAAELFGIWAGSNGAWIKEASKENGLKISGISIEGNNRKCYTFRSASEEINNTEILEPGPELSEEEYKEFRKKFSSVLKDTALVCMSGSWPAKAPEDAYAQLIKIAKQKQKKCIVDVGGVQLDAIVKEGCFGIHLNEHEALANFGTIDISKIAKQFKQIELIALTKGKDGLLLYYKGEIIAANTTINNPISTVGSGDCLTAGIAYAVTKQMKIEEIASWGVACGAANCINEDLGMIKRDDVLELLGKISIKKVV